MQKFKVSRYVNKKVVNNAWNSMKRNSTVRFGIERTRRGRRAVLPMPCHVTKQLKLLSDLCSRPFDFK